MASWLNVAANLGVIAIPIGLLMIAGELDISVGAMVPFGAMTVAVLSGHYGLPIWVGVACALSFGRDRRAGERHPGGASTAVPSLIVTLGSLFAVQGIVLGLTVLMTKSTSVALNAKARPRLLFGHFVGRAGSGHGPVVAGADRALCLLRPLRPSGTGSSPWAATRFQRAQCRHSDRPADHPPVRAVRHLCRLCRHVPGDPVTTRPRSRAGMSFIFNAIISVVVGGVLLTGGFGSVIGIFFGTITFAIVTQGIYYTDFDRNWSSLIIGVLLLGAVLMNNTFRKMALSYSPKKGTKA
jgi:simple sugar transport system permease protein